MWGGGFASRGGVLLSCALPGSLCRFVGGWLSLGTDFTIEIRDRHCWVQEEEALCYNEI